MITDILRTAILEITSEMLIEYTKNIEKVVSSFITFSVRSSIQNYTLNEIYLFQQKVY